MSDTNIYEEGILISGTKRIEDLYPLNKLTGKEEILVDNGDPDNTYKATIDTLLGYIAKQINSGTIPEDVFKSSNIVVIPEGEEIPIGSRSEDTFYLNITNSEDIYLSTSISRLVVSPNMGLKIIND